MNKPWTRRTLGLALAMSVGGAAAATSDDNGAQGFHDGTGDGDLVLALRAGTKSIAWDLSGTIGGAANDLTVNDILTLAAAGQGFTLTNTDFSQFLLDNPTTDIEWNLFGISNKGRPFDDPAGPVPDQVGIVSTIDLGGALNPPTGGDLGFSLQSNAQWLLDNVDAGLADNGTLVAASAGDTHFFVSPFGRHGSEIGGQDATADSFGETLALYFLRKDPTRPVFDSTGAGPGADELPVLPELLGSLRLTLTGSVAELTFTSATPVPLPAAAWLFGAGLAGLAGVARRRR
ncbi:MAG: VPLPA-CTERM sorting domain-containing protein [Gammaproteobacteria bacterium]